jgi:hypothetical protein
MQDFAVFHGLISTLVCAVEIDDGCTTKRTLAALKRFADSAKHSARPAWIVAWLERC